MIAKKKYVLDKKKIDDLRKEEGYDNNYEWFAALQISESTWHRWMRDGTSNRNVNMISSLLGCSCKDIEQ